MTTYLIHIKIFFNLTTLKLCQLSFSSIPTFASLPEGEEAINKVLSEAKTTFIGNDCPLELIISAGAAAARVAPFSVSISLFVRDSISV